MSTDKKQYKCSYCKKGFRLEYHLLNHTRILHPTENDLTCPLCSKVFTSSIGLRKHRWNNHENMNICDICGKVFLKVFELNSHVKKMHEGKRQFDCEQCGKVNFSKPIYLKKHIAAVHERRRFKCTKCSKDFSRKSYLNKHIEYVHEGKGYFCNHCEKDYSSSYLLKKHIANGHEGKIVLT